MNSVIEVLMRRDELTRTEAKAHLNHVRQMLSECSYDPDESEDIIYSELGLELDYLEDILWTQ